EEDTCSSDDEKNKALSVSVGVKYGEKEFWGRGKDYYWIDAFADLQKKLPSGVTLKCCLTCKNGNMCPVGQKPDELFCTKDVCIKEKSDLYFYTEDSAQREKRLRTYTDVCKEYQNQTSECFTYNDYYYAFLKS
ncbi:MAG: hypothetical protein J6V82_04915, partial [Clostridia bacterium]|nr:hypothetical protein [Clostridia bacterium]